MSKPETHLLLRNNLKQLRLPTVLAEFEKLAREAADAHEGYEQYLLRLTELEVAARATPCRRRPRESGWRRTGGRASDSRPEPRGG